MLRFLQKFTFSETDNLSSLIPKISETVIPKTGSKLSVAVIPYPYDYLMNYPVSPIPLTGPCKYEGTQRTFHSKEPISGCTAKSVLHLQQSAGRLKKKLTKQNIF